MNHDKARYTDLFEGAAGEDGAVSLSQLQDAPSTHPPKQRMTLKVFCGGVLAAAQDDDKRRALDKHHEGGLDNKRGAEVIIPGYSRVKPHM